MWTEVIIYQEVPNCPELNFFLCFLESGASGTTVQICPERLNEFESRTPGSDKKVDLKDLLPDLFNLQPMAPDPL